MPPKLDIDQIKIRLAKNCYNLIFLDDFTYVNIKTKCRFIDKEYGEFYAIPDNVIRGKANHTKRKSKNRRQTNLKRYGAICPAKNKKILKKMYNTNLKRYGTKYPIQLESVKEKTKQTCLKKYRC